MPYQIKFEHSLAGYTRNAATQADEPVQVVFKEFLSSEDGMTFIKRLEDFVNPILGLLPPESTIKPSQIDHLLLHFDSSGEGFVYVNELTPVALMQAKNNVLKGQAIYENDIADVSEVKFKILEGEPVFNNNITDISQLKFKEIEIPSEHAVLILFSIGWRKGLYFDFEPNLPGQKCRTYDLWNALGQCYNYVFFQEIHSITEETWKALFAEKWFPFVGLTNATIKSLLSWISSGHSADQILATASAEVKSRLPTLRQSWKDLEQFSDHQELLSIAADRFEANDWISANSILYTRLEGLLRSISKASGNTNFNQINLSNALLDSKVNQPISRILPSHFQKYLEEVYFASFDPKSAAGISRHSVGHGVAPASEFSEKAAVIGFLIVEQILHHLPKLTKNSDTTV
jgi:hypothetical protein